MRATLLRTATGLIAGDEWAIEQLNSLTVGKAVAFEIVKVRNPAQLRAYWALVRFARQHQGYYATDEDMSDAIKCALGHCHVITKGDGTIIQRPKSIAFGNMDQDDFNQFMDGATRLIAETMGVTLDDLKREVA